MVTTTILMVGLLASSTVFTRCSNTKSEQQEEVKDHAHEEDDASDELVYACPMHPEITGKDGDACSKCGMKLELADTADSTDVHE